MTPAVKNTTHLMNKTLCSEKEPIKACNKQINIFDYSNSAVKNETEKYISEKETQKEKSKKNLIKTIGLAVLFGCCCSLAFIAKDYIRTGKYYRVHTKNAQKYIKKHCNVFKENELTIITGKNTEIVDLSKLGKLDEGTIVRYNTTGEARQAAKDYVMKPFELPFHLQKEIGVVVEGRNVTYTAVGNEHCVKMPHKKLKNGTKRTAEFYHNHPGDVTLPYQPLSVSDVMYMCSSSNKKSITAFNCLGEYNRAEIPDSMNQYCSLEIYDPIRASFAERLLGKEKGMKLMKLTRTCCETSSERYKEYQNLVNEYNISYHNLSHSSYDNLSKHNTQKFIELHHETYQKVLPKFGIKYTTNYSNLKNIQNPPV